MESEGQFLYYYVLCTTVGQLIQPFGLTGASLTEGLGICLNLFGIGGSLLASFLYKGKGLADFRKSILGCSFISLIGTLYFLIVLEA